MSGGSADESDVALTSRIVLLLKLTFRILSYIILCEQKSNKIKWMAESVRGQVPFLALWDAFPCYCKKVFWQKHGRVSYPFCLAFTFEMLFAMRNG